MGVETARVFLTHFRAFTDDESFDEFYAKLNDVVNSAYNLVEVYDQPKIFRKILRSLTKDIRPKVTALKAWIWTLSLLMNL